jgi:hemoglobin
LLLALIFLACQNVPKKKDKTIEMQDINTRSEILAFLKLFYQNIYQDNLLSPIFVEILGENLDTHLSSLADFWENVLFHNKEYKKNVLQIHINIHQKLALQKMHFDRWLELFNTTMNQMFEGSNADTMKIRASGVATLMLHKIATL